MVVWVKGRLPLITEAITHNLAMEIRYSQRIADMVAAALCKHSPASSLGGVLRLGAILCRCVIIRENWGVEYVSKFTLSLRVWNCPAAIV